MAAALLIRSVVFGQGSISGQVVLEGDTSPVPYVYVYVEGTQKGVLTDAEGRFQMKDLMPGTYRLVVSGLGYGQWEQEVRVGTQPVEVVAEVEELVMGLPSVVVQSVSLTGGLRGLKEVPGSAAYLSPKDLDRFSYTDINRTLRAVPGVNLQEEDGFGLRPNIGLRGTGAERSSKITLMEDGVLAAPAPYSAPAAYYFPTIGRMQGVEVLKGSSQIRFGPYTTGGAINLLSTAIPTEFSGRLDLLAGEFRNRNLHAYVGDSRKHFGYLVETFQYQSDGFKKLDGGGDTGFDKKDYLAKFRLNTAPDASVYQSLTFKVGQTTETSNETYLGLSEADFEADPFRRYAGSQKDVMRTRHEQYSLQHLLQLNSHTDLTTTLYRNEFHRNWYKLDKVVDSQGNSVKIAALLDNPKNFPEAYDIVQGATSPNDDALHVKANNRSYLSTGVQTVLSHRFHSTELEHTLDLGLRYHYDEIDRYQWVDAYKMEDGVMELTRAGRPGTESNRIESAKAFAAYLQYKLQFERWTFIPGLRYENMDLERKDYGKSDPERLGTDLKTRQNQVDVFIPGIGVNYQYSREVQLFAGVHRGFSPPGNKEGTRPEKSINYELGARLNKGALSGQTALFFSDYENLLGTDLAAAGGGGTGDLFNGGAVQTKGLELQLTYDPLTGSGSSWTLPLTVVYTFTDAEFQNSFESDFEGWGTVQAGDELPYLPKNQLTLMAGLQGLRFALNLSARYQDAMRTQAGHGPIPENQKTDAYFVIDANASYALHPKASLFLSMTNLTDAVYVVARRPAGLRPGMPRTLMGGLKVKF